MKFKNQAALAVVMALMSFQASATQPVDTGPTCNGNGSCATTTNNNFTTTNQGGSAAATASATGGAVVGSGNSTNSLSTKQQQDQSQLQLQLQGQGQFINDSGNSSSTVKNSGNSSSTSSVKNAGNNVGNSQASSNGNSVTVVGDTVTYEAAHIPVNSAIAPTIFPTAPCMGSSSAAGSGAFISLSAGSSWTSDECMILETARSFDQAGFQQDGLAVRCQGKWAKNAPSCKAIADAQKPVAAATVAKPTVATAEATPAKKSVVVKAIAQTQPETPATSANGYYSVNSNPLTK